MSGTQLSRAESTVKVEPSVADYLALLAPAFSAPLLLWAQNYVGVGHPERLLLIGLAAWAVAASVLWVTRRIGADLGISLAAVWAGTYVFMRGGAVIQTYGYLLGPLLTAVIFGIVLYLVSRRARTHLRAIIFLATAFLIIEVVLAWYSSYSTLGEDTSQPPAPALDLNLEQRPDIILIIPDALIGTVGLEQYFGVGGVPIVTGLEQHGFELPELAFSPYVSTRSALASILGMDYPLISGPGITKATSQTLYDRISGDNRLVDVLEDNGYRITMNESGWSGSMCGEAVDQCIVSPFLDESTFFVLAGTWLGPAVQDRYGYAFTVGALRSMTWLEDNLPSLTADSTPDFVLAHLEIPHPPFFLDEECNLDTSPNRSGTTMNWREVDLDDRKAAYLDQVACLHGFLTPLIGSIDDQAIVVVAGDHGTDLHDQLFTHPEEWSVDATRERLNVLLAYRGLECPLADPIVLTAVFAQILACLANEEVPEIESRLFRYAAVQFGGQPSPIVELSDDEKQQLFDGEAP